MGFKKINSLKVSLFTHLVVALVFSIILSFDVQNIAGHVKETIWLEYIDADELYEFQNKYSSQFGGVISVPQVMNSEMDKADQFWVGVCEFMESWSVFILTFTSVYIALTIFYNRRLKKPLHILNSCAEKISQQELNFSVDYTKKDEMGQLCGAFEKMREQLQLNNSEMWNMIEEQKQMRSAFSHDLRTPLSVLKGYVEYLIRYYPKGKLSQEKIMETLDDFSEQIRRIEDFSDTMKSINRMDDLCVRRSKVVASILQRKTADVFDTLSGTGKKEYSIVEKLSQEQFNIDMDVYLEILENVVGNAMRYATSSVKLEIWDEKGWLHFMVSDDGPGFTSEELTKATKPYFHGKSTGDCHYGMGLYICECLFFVGKLVRISRDSGLYLATMWFIMEMSGGVKMTTSDMVRRLCEKMNISISELARKIGQSPQNFNKKLLRETVSFSEMLEIADALGIRYEQAFILPSGIRIEAGNKQ